VISARQDNAKKVADALARQVKKSQIKQPLTITTIRQKARLAAKAVRWDSSFDFRWS
jgi:hypothetical protein